MLFSKKIFKNFSISKTYRILQKLYELGFLLKIKNEAKQHYIPLPPSFLYSNSLIDKRIINYLEKIYYKNCFEFIIPKIMFFEASGNFFEGLIVFLIKYLMKKESILMIGGPDIPKLLKKTIPNKINSIKIIGRKDYFKDYFEEKFFLLNGNIIGNRRILIIDESICIESLKTPYQRYLGYLTTDSQTIKVLKEELLSLIKENKEL